MNKQTFMKSIGKAMAAIMAAAIVFTAIPASVYAETTGKVTVDTAKVRADASTNSDTVKQIASGTTVTVTDKKTDSSGNVWYQVSLSDGTTGYIRSDLLEVTETADAPAEDTAAEETAPAEDTSSDAGSSNVVDGIDISAIVVPDGVDHTDLQKATVNVSAGKIRSNASTNDSIVATLAEGEKLVIAGSKLGSDSKTWYFVAFVDGGTQKTGYIRSDLINIGETIQAAETAPAEPADEQPAEEDTEPVAEATVNNDYELVYTDDGTGNNVWYLYNHIDNTREKLQELLDFADYQQKQQGVKDAEIKKLRVLLIVLAALLLLAIVAVAFLIIKLRGEGYDYYADEEYRDSRRDERTSSRRRRYEEEDDDEEEEEEEEEIPVSQRRRRQAEDDVPATQRRRRQDDDDVDSRRARSNTPRRPVTYEDEDDVKVAPAPKKNKSKNFIIDDDFEFEFLNVDDK